MNIQPLVPNFKAPVKSSNLAGAYDLFMPEAGIINPHADFGEFVGLGFAAHVPDGHVALLLPRSGKGAKYGLSLNNTVGVIDPDYRGEWIACLRNRNSQPFTWNIDDRLIQMLIIKIEQVEFNIVDSLDETERNTGGFGSTD